MNNKRAIVITVIIAVLLFLCTVIVSYRYTHRFEMIEKELEERQPPASPYTIEDVQDSSAAYLLSPDFEITEDNAQKVIYDYFTAPTRLSFTVVSSVKYSDMEETEYVCDDLTANTNFGNMFQNKIIYDTEEDVGVMVTQGTCYFFVNDIGEIHLSCIKGRTYIYFQRFAFPNQGFIIEEEIVEEIEGAIENVLPYAMEVFAMG